MDYANIFLYMRAEVTLTAVLVLIFLFDLFAPERMRRHFSAVACGLLVVQLLVNLVPHEAGVLFGGMFRYEPMHGVVKSILTIGTLLVFLQADTWLRRDDTRHKQGEFYILTLSTLLGLFFMIGADNFLLFFIGMELASVPMACLVAFDKYKGHSAEAGAKFILSALFASGLMLYGISVLYGTTGTLYFDDMAARIDGSPLQVLSLVFGGLGRRRTMLVFSAARREVIDEMFNALKTSDYSVVSYEVEAQRGDTGVVYRATLVIRARGNADEEGYVELLRAHPDVTVERIV